jgi:hypothetical protein
MTLLSHERIQIQILYSTRQGSIDVGAVLTSRRVVEGPTLGRVYPHD